MIIKLEAKIAIPTDIEKKPIISINQFNNIGVTDGKIIDCY